MVTGRAAVITEQAFSSLQSSLEARLQYSCQRSTINKTTLKKKLQELCVIANPMTIHHVAIYDMKHLKEKTISIAQSISEVAMVT